MQWARKIDQLGLIGLSKDFLMVSFPQIRLATVVSSKKRVGGPLQSAAFKKTALTKEENKNRTKPQNGSSLKMVKFDVARGVIIHEI